MCPDASSAVGLSDASSLDNLVLRAMQSQRKIEIESQVAFIAPMLYASDNYLIRNLRTRNSSPPQIFPPHLAALQY